MSTFTPPEEHSLLLAEYALGVLDRETRASVAQQVQASAVLAAELALWQERLAPLAEDIQSVVPPPELWKRIEAELGFDAQRQSAVRRRTGALWDNVRFWRWLGLGASAGFAALALCFVAILVTVAPDGSQGARAWLASLQSSPRPDAAPIVSGYQFASLVQPSGAIAWTATLDAAQARMIVVPSADAQRQIAADRAAELWLVPHDGKPIALGLLTPQQAVIVLLSDPVMRTLGHTASLAVSVEPAGGSRTGQPTGPIVAQGAIRGV